MSMQGWQRTLVAVLALLASCAVRAENLTIAIEGLKPDIEAAARANLTLEHYNGRDVSAAQVRRLFRSGEKEISAALEPYGYYNSRVASSLVTNEKGFNALFRVTLGEPTLVTEQKVSVVGEAATLTSVQRAVRRFRP